MGRRRATRQRDAASEGSIRLRALLSAGMVLGLGAVGTLAAWTDESTATATFTAGTLDLKLKEMPNGALADSVGITSLNMTNMYPGVSKAGLVQVSNSGSVPLSYTLTSSAIAGGTGGSLGTSLQVGVHSGATVTGTPPAESCSGGTSVGGPASLASLSVTGPTTLAPANTEILCLVVSMPLDADTSLQGKSATATFTFNAKLGS